MRFFDVIRTEFRKSMNITVSTNLHTTVNESTQYFQNLSLPLSLSIPLSLSKCTFFDFFDVIRTEFREYHSFYKPTHNSQRLKQYLKISLSLSLSINQSISQSQCTEIIYMTDNPKQSKKRTRGPPGHYSRRIITDSRTPNLETYNSISLL